MNKILLIGLLLFGGVAYAGEEDFARIFSLMFVDQLPELTSEYPEPKPAWVMKSGMTEDFLMMGFFNSKHYGLMIDEEFSAGHLFELMQKNNCVILSSHKEHKWQYLGNERSTIVFYCLGRVE